jgi:hypothetical protein
VAFILSLLPTDHRVIAQFRVAGSTKRGKGSYHGVEIRFWVLPLDASPPQTADDKGWRSEICTKTPWRHTFDADEIGKRLYIAMRWENESVASDEEASKGPWSEIESVIIP